ncbi:hypothetical protein FACS189425_00180 [Clostridia bacterium]|nr:hypothetical protein FACS189425_00180 [Clostridia bacterium]
MKYIRIFSVAMLTCVIIACFPIRQSADGTMNTSNMLINPPLVKINSTLETHIRPPILMYHLISTPPKSPNSYLFVDTNTFDWQMSFVKWHNFTPLFPEEINTSDNHINPILITFDDGYEDNYTNAFPIIKKYSIKVTIFLVAGKIDQPDYLTRTQIREMSDSGMVRFGSHTCTHTDLATLSHQNIEKEFEISNDIIYNTTNVPVRAVSYPYGKVSQGTFDIAANYYNVGFMVAHGSARNLMSLGRLTAPNTTREFARMLTRYMR